MTVVRMRDYIVYGHVLVLVFFIFYKASLKLLKAGYLQIDLFQQPIN